MTLYEEVVRDLAKKAADSTFKMNQAYFRRQRSSFLDPAHPSKRLKAAEGDDTAINEACLHAMVAIKKNPNDTSAMQVYLGQAAKPTTAECVGLLKWALDLNPSHPKQITALLDIMRYIERTNVKTEYTTQWECVRLHLDRAMCIARTKARKVEPIEFAKTHALVLSLFMDSGSLDKVI